MAKASPGTCCSCQSWPGAEAQGSPAPCTNLEQLLLHSVPSSAHRSCDVQYLKTFSKILTFSFFLLLIGRKETEWSLEASKGRKAGDSVRTWGHAVHGEAEALFLPPICQTERYKELRNQEMSGKYRKALKPFVIKQN